MTRSERTLLRIAGVLVFAGLLAFMLYPLPSEDGVAQRTRALTPDQEVFVEYPAGTVDKYLVLLNDRDNKVILLYGTRTYTDSRPLILTYQQFYESWTKLR